MTTGHTKNLILSMMLESDRTTVEPIDVYAALAFRKTHANQAETVASMTTGLDLLRICAGLDTFDGGVPIHVVNPAACAIIASGTVGEMATAVAELVDDIADMGADKAAAVGILRH